MRFIYIILFYFFISFSLQAKEFFLDFDKACTGLGVKLSNSVKMNYKKQFTNKSLNINSDYFMGELEQIQKELIIIAKDIYTHKQIESREVRFSEKNENIMPYSPDSINVAIIPFEVKKIIKKNNLILKDKKKLQEVINELKLMQLFDERDKRAEINYIRLAPIFMLAKGIYTEIKAPDKYTQITDGESKNQKGHYYIVANLLPKHSDFTTVVAALFHDIERFFIGTKVPYFNKKPLKVLGNNNMDTVLRKKATHPISSCQVTNFLLKNFNVTVHERNIINNLIKYHDSGSKGVEINIKSDFFNKTKKIVFLPKISDKPHKKLNTQIDAISSADSIAFFGITMEYFVIREFDKIKKYSDTNKYKEGKLELINRVKLSFNKIKTHEEKSKAILLAENQYNKIESNQPHKEIFLELINSIKSY